MKELYFEDLVDTYSKVKINRTSIKLENLKITPGPVTMVSTNTFYTAEHNSSDNVENKNDKFYENDLKVRAMNLAYASTGKFPKYKGGSVQITKLHQKKIFLKLFNQYGGDITKINIIRYARHNGELIYFNI